MLTKITLTIWERLKLGVARRRQAISGRLRRIFREHRINVGLYSCECFYQWRMLGPIRIGRWYSFSTVRSAPINHPMGALTTPPALYERKFEVHDADISWDTPLIIEDDGWGGYNVVILPGCKFIRRGSVIGAGAIATRDVTACTIVAWNPARLLRQGFPPEMIASLKANRWWEMDASDLRALVAEQRDVAFHPAASALDAWTAGRGGLAQ